MAELIHAFDRSSPSRNPLPADLASGVATRAVRGAGLPRPGEPLLVPIAQASTFAQAAIGDPIEHTYSRASNPTVAALERALGSIEGAPPAVAFASGLAATHAVALATLAAGDHAVVGRASYGGTVRLFRDVLAPLGITVTFVDATDPARVAAAITARTRLLLIETPTNPTLELADVAALGLLARAGRVTFVVDNTFLTAAQQRPLDLGADATVLSTTKWIDGHHATIGGAVTSHDEAFLAKLRFLRKSVGSIQAPHDAWLTLQGLKTLPLRLARHAASALELARWLDGQPGVERVLYPGLRNHPQHDLARRQHRGGAHGGIIALEIAGSAERPDGGLAAARRFAEGLRLFTLAESVGGAESLITHPATMTHGDVPAPQRAAVGITDGLVRLSIGLEDVEDLRRDLASALARVTGQRSPREQPREEVARAW